MKKSIVLFIAFVFLTSIAFGQAAGDFRSITPTGNWGDAATWQRYDGGGWVAAPSYPGEFGGTGVVTIQDNHSITLNNSPANSIGSLVIQTGNNNTTFTIGAFTLNVTGNVLIDQATGNINKTIAVTPSGVLNCASITMVEGNNDNRKSYLTFIAGTVNVTGNITMGAGAVRTYLQFLAGGTLNVGGTITGGNILPGTGTVNFNSSAPQNIPVYNYNNLTFTSGWPSQNKNMTGNLTVTGNLSVNNASLKLLNFNLTMGSAAATTLRIFTNSRVTIDGTGILSGAAGGGAETLQMDNGGSLTINTPTANIPVFDTYSIGELSTLEYYGNTNQAITTPAGVNWGKINFQGDGFTKTLNNDLAFTEMTIFGTSILNLPASRVITMRDASFSFPFNVVGSLTGSGKVVFAGNNEQFIQGSNPTFYDIEINKGNANAKVTIQAGVTVTNTLTLTQGKVNTTTHPLTLTNAVLANQLSGGSANAYVYSSGAGRLRRNGLNNTISNALFPVGTDFYYLPVEISQSGAAPADFAINVFEGATTNGAEGGTLMPDKTNIVNAIWNVDRPTGSGAATVKFNWANGLEGSVFSGFGDAAIKIAKYNSGWSQFGAAGTGGTANAAANQASESFTSFSPFLVGGGSIFTTLPVKLLSFDASTSNCSSLVKWKTTNEVNVDHIELQVSYDNNNWSTVQTLAATNNPSDISNYSVSYNHGNRSGNKLLRLKMVDIDGKFTYSKIISVQCGKDNVLSVYPNPATNSITLTGTKTNDRVQVIGMDGRTVLNLFATEGNTQLNIESLASGTYQIRVLSDTKWMDAGRFVKQ